MKVGQCLWVVVVVCIGIMIGPSIAHALVCGQSGEIPTFTVTLDPNTVPSPPPEPHSPSSLELYRTKLEIFLQNTVEGYNRKLIAFGKNLDLLDQRFRNAMANGFCASTEYETLKDKLDLEQGKIGSDYIEPYYECVNAYKQYFKWYQHELARIRLSAYELEMRGDCFVERLSTRRS